MKDKIKIQGKEIKKEIFRMRARLVFVVNIIVSIKNNLFTISSTQHERFANNYLYIIYNA